MRHCIAIISVLISLSIHAQETEVFEYTGEVETYYVPDCVTQLEVVVKGARGGGSRTARRSPKR